MRLNDVHHLAVTPSDENRGLVVTLMMYRGMYVCKGEMVDECANIAENGNYDVHDASESRRGCPWKKAR
jgi:hypothetical protein